MSCADSGRKGRVMSKFTPGPWERRGKAIVAKGAPLWNNAYSGRICNVQGNGHGKTEINETAEANAQLIAAAPMMLDALEATCNWCKQTINDETGEISYQINAGCTDCHIAAAIKAAKGSDK